MGELAQSAGLTDGSDEVAETRYLATPGDGVSVGIGEVSAEMQVFFYSVGIGGVGRDAGVGGEVGRDAGGWRSRRDGGC